MKAIIAEGINSNLSEMLQSLKVAERELPEVSNNQLLIKIHGANVNPSDIAFLRGMYNVTKDFPAVPGFEGSGIVVNTGSSVKSFAGKKVCCFKQDNTDGTWAEYTVVNAEQCLILKDEFPDDYAPSFFINPFTAYGLIEKAIKSNAKAIIQNAAAGQVGQIVRYLAGINNIKVINIVRRPAHVERLKNEGDKFVLNSRDKNFKEQFSELISLLQPQIAFDAVAGEITETFLQLMPFNSNIVIYGGLSGAPVSIDVLKVIFENKTISGFNLNKWFSDSGKEKIDQVSDILQNHVIAGHIRTKIQQTIGFDDVYKGLYQYLSKMSDGKVIIRP